MADGVPTGSFVLVQTSYTVATNRSAQIATAAGCHQNAKDGTLYWFTILTNSTTFGTGFLVPVGDTNKLTNLEWAALIPYVTNWTGF